MHNKMFHLGMDKASESRHPAGPSMPIPRTVAQVELLEPQHREGALRGAVNRLGLEIKLDALTGALNAKAFQESIEEDMTKRPDIKRGLVFVDLGNFKKVNGKNGSTQAVGDNVLRIVAGLFNREADLVGRLGGDEFALFVDLEKRNESDKTEDDVLADQVERITSLRSGIIELYPDLDQGPIRFFIAAGGSPYDPTASYEDNLQNANTAMSEAKEADYATYGRYRVSDAA